MESAKSFSMAAEPAESPSLKPLCTACKKSGSPCAEPTVGIIRQSMAATIKHHFFTGINLLARLTFAKMAVRYTAREGIFALFPMQNGRASRVRSFLN